MFINLYEFIKNLNEIPLNEIPNYVKLCFDETGFHLQGKDLEDTKILNNKWQIYITTLNKIVGFEELLTVTQIAKHLKMSPNTIYTILKEQDSNKPILPCINTSKGIRIKSSDYINYLNNCYCYLESPQNTKKLKNENTISETKSLPTNVNGLVNIQNPPW